jgi:hypothetical protein
MQSASQRVDVHLYTEKCDILRWYLKSQIGAAGVAQAVKVLASKHKAMNSSSSAAKNKNYSKIIDFFVGFCV